MIVRLRRRGPEVVCPTPANCKPFVATAFDIQDFANIEAAGGGDETATMVFDQDGSPSIISGGFVSLIEVTGNLSCVKLLYKS